MSPRAPLVLGVLVALLLALAGQGAVAAAQTTTTVTTTVTSGGAPAAGSPLQTVSRAGSTDPNGVEYAPSETTPPAEPDESGADHDTVAVALPAVAVTPWGALGVAASMRALMPVTLAAAIGEESDTIEDVYEPYLLQRGFIQRTPRGRTATARAYRHLGLPTPGGATELFS